MNTQEILSTLADRNGAIIVLRGRLLVTPASALTPDLREAMRANRADLERHAREQLPMVRAVLNVFGGEVVRSYPATISSDEQRIEDHLPATVVRGCWRLYRTCQRTCRGVSCGDCSLFAAQDKLACLREKRGSGRG